MQAPVIVEGNGTRTRAELPRPGLDRPLAKEARDPSAFAPGFDMELWVEERLVRFGLPRPWQRVISHDEQAQEVVFERFIGITLADVLDCTRRHGHLLPLDAWVPLALEVVEAFDGLAPEGLRWGLESSGVGWSLSGELVLSLTSLNSVLRSELTDAVRLSRPHQFALLSPEQVRGLPPTRASVASTALSAVLQLLCGVGPFHRASNLDEVRAIFSGALTLPSELHPGANPALDEVARRAAAAHPQRWAAPAEVCSALRSELRGVERAAAVRALFALCETPLRQRLALARRDRAWLPEAWEGVFPRCADPAAALAVMEDRLSEALPSLADFPRARQFAPSK